MAVSEEQSSIITSKIKWPSLGNKSYEDLIIEESEKEGIDPSLPLAIHYAGEQYHPERAITSPKAATGPMQLIPSTAKMLGVDPRDERQNISGGVRYVKQMLKEFDNDEDLAIAAYNAGPGAVRRYKGIPPFKETRDYHKRVTEYRSKPPPGLEWEPAEVPPDGLLWEPVGSPRPEPQPEIPAGTTAPQKIAALGDQALDAVRPYAEGMAPMIPEAEFLQGQAPAPEIQPQPQPEPNLPPSEAIQQVAAPAMDRLGAPQPDDARTKLIERFAASAASREEAERWRAKAQAMKQREGAGGPVGGGGWSDQSPPVLNQPLRQFLGAEPPAIPYDPKFEERLDASEKNIVGIAWNIDQSAQKAKSTESPLWVNYHNDLVEQYGSAVKQHNDMVKGMKVEAGLAESDLPLLDPKYDPTFWATVMAQGAAHGVPFGVPGMVAGAGVAALGLGMMEEGAELGGKAGKAIGERLAGEEGGRYGEAIGSGLGAGLGGAIPFGMVQAAKIELKPPNLDVFKDRLLRLTKTKAGVTIEYTPEDVRAMFTTGGDPEKDALLRSLGLTGAQYKEAMKRGVTITTPEVTVDKPWWKEVKAFFGAAPEPFKTPAGKVGAEYELGKAPKAEPVAPEKPIAPTTEPAAPRAITAPEGIPGAEPVPSAPTAPLAITAPEVAPPAEPIAPPGLPGPTTEAVPVGKPYGEVGVKPIPMEGEVTPKQLVAPEAEAVDAEPTGPTDKIYLPDNTVIEVRYGLREAKDLVASHDRDGRVNDAYPSELQPRDRERAASKIQVGKITANLNPERLGRSQSAGAGAPIIGKDNVVESGNARTIALRSLYWGSKGEPYKQWLRDNAEQFGLTAEQVDAMKQPVLVRERLTDMDRVEFARQANKPDMASMSPSEIARMDADRITTGHMATFNTPEDGNVLASSNRPFVRSFLQLLGTEESAQYLTKEGQYTKQLADRIQAAVFERAYANPRLLALVAEEADPDIKNILNALNRAAPEFALSHDLGITDDINMIPFISEAAGLVQRAKVQGVSLEKSLSQMSMLSRPTVEGIRLAKYFAENIRSSKRMGDTLAHIGRAINSELRQRGNVEMFPRKKPTARDIMESSLNRAEDIHGEAKGQQQTIFAKHTTEGGAGVREQPSGGRTPAGGPRGVGEPSAEYGAGEARTALKPGDITTPEFREWSGGIEPVVDASPRGKHQFRTGEEVVVKGYHGSVVWGKPLSSFSPEKRGSATGASSAKKAFFFGGYPDTARAYTSFTGGKGGFASSDALHKDFSTKMTRLGKLIEDTTLDMQTHPVGSARNISNKGKVERRLRRLDSIFKYMTILNPKRDTRLSPYYGNLRDVDQKARWEIQRLFEGDPKSGIETVFQELVLHGATYPVYVKIENPYVHDYGGKDYREDTFSDIIDRAKELKHDGVIFTNVNDAGPGGPIDNIFAVFSDTQIKSIWNKGFWSKTDPRILSEPESRLEPKTKGAPDAKELQAEWERLIEQAGTPVGPVSSAGGALGPAQKGQATQKGQPRTIAKSFQQQLEKKQRIEFRGTPISGPEDLAELGHKYLRQAEFEVFHVFLVVDGKIGAHEAVSSRLPGSAVPFADVDKAIWQMRNRADRLRAKAKAAGNPGEIRIFRLHNHPTGYVAPSDKDLEFDSDLVNIAPRSEKTIAWIPEMDSHIIINGEEWAEIDVNGGVTYHDFTLPEGWKDPVLTPSVDHPLLSATIVSPGDIANIGKALESETDMPVLMYYSGSEAKVRGIHGVPRSILMSKGAGNWIRGQARAFGSQYVALYDPNPTVEAIRQYHKLYQNGHLVDYVHPAGKGYASGFMKSGERIAPAQADRERWQGKTALKPGVRVAEKKSWYGTKDEVAELGVAGRSTTGPIPSSGDIPRPTRRSKIIKDLAKAFDVPIRFGRFRQKAAGIYKYGPKVIRLKKANDVEVAVHEIGHHIENLLGLGGRQPDEVRNMAYAGAKNVDREGFAEFLRYYVTNPTVAQTQAPNFYTRFEQALDQNPDVRDVLIKARMAWQEWQATPSIGKVMSFIVRGSEAPKPRWTLSKVYTALLDELYPLKMLRDFAGGKLGHELPILKDPYALAWLTRGWARKAEQILKWGQYRRDAQGQLQKIGPSFRDILGPIEEAGERHLLDAYLVAKRGVNDPRILQGFEGVLSPEDLQQTVTELEPRFRETADKLYELSSNLLDMLVDSGRITKDAADQIRKDNQFYAPLYRVMDVDSRIGGLSKKKFGNVFSPIKRLKGSSRDIFSPTENYMYNIFAFVNSAERNKIGEAMIGVSKIEGMGEVIEKLPVKMSPTKISKDDFMALLKKYGDVEQISSVTQTETETTNQLNSVGPTSTDRMDAVVKEALTARGWTDAEATQIIGRVKNAANPQERTDIIEKTVEKTTVMVIKEKLGFGNMPDQMIANFRPNYNTAPNEVIFYNRGKPEVYELSPELYSAIMASNPETLSLIVRVLAFPAKMLRAGATTTLEFMARNPLRDQMTAYVYSEHGYKPGWDLLKGIAHILGKSEIYQAYNESGAAHAALVSMDRNYLSKSYDDLMNSNRVKGIAKQIIKNPIELLRALSEITEEATRVGEFAKAYTKGGKTAAAGAESGIAARDITLDFSRKGSQTASINAIIAFWNAQLQGTDKMVRAFKSHPWRTLFRSIAGITLPSLLLWAAQKDDPAYQEIPTWRRILFWNIVTHKPDGSTNHIWSIPRPFELGILFGAVPEMMLDWYYTKDPEGAKEVVRSFLQAALPSYMPTALIPMVEWISGYSLFFDRPIVQRGKEQLRQSLQYGPNTSEFLKLVARNMEKVPGMEEFANPAKLQNLIQGYSAGLGRMGLEGIDSVLKATGLVKVPLEPSLTLSDMPGIRAFVARYPGANTRSIEKFYRRYNQMVTDYESAKEDIGIRGMSKLDKDLRIKNKPLDLQEMQSIAQALSVYRTVADVVHKSNPKVANSKEADAAREIKRQQLDHIYLSMVTLARIGIGLEPMRSIPAPVKTEVAK